MVEPKRILLIRLSHLGDVVHALPVYHALRATWPRAELAWVVQPEFSDLVAGLSGVAHVVHFDRTGGAGAWLRLREELGALGPDLAVDAQGNLKSGLVTLTSGAARRVGLARSDWREPLGALACPERAEPATGGHAIDRMLRLVAHLTGAGQAADHDSARFDPEVQPEELAAGRHHLARLFATGTEQRVILQLSDPADVRSWPADHALRLIDTLLERGTAVAVLSGPGEAGLGAEVARLRPESALLRHWVGQRGLRDLAGFFTAAAESAVRFVGSDSGPMHLAWSCGLRVVSLAGPQSHRATGPWPVPLSLPEARGAQSPAAPHRVVQATPAPACAPCLKRHCTHPEGPVCMRDLLPSAVLDAISSEDRVLAASGPPGSTA